jgi:TP901 family phage tail tape measure protein
MNEQLINEIKQAIQQLEEQRRKLEGLGQSTASVTSQISNLTKGLTTLSSEAGLVGKALQNAEVQLNKFFAAAKAGQNVRVDTPFGRMRSGLLAGTEFNEVNKAAKDLDAVMAQSPESMRSKGIEEIIQSLTKEREALASGSKEYINRTLFINTLNDTLKKLNGEITVSTKELDKLKKQTDNVLRSLQAGVPGSFPLDGGRFNTRPFIEASEKARAATQELNQVAATTSQSAIQGVVGGSAIPNTRISTTQPISLNPEEIKRLQEANKQTVKNLQKGITEIRTSIKKVRAEGEKALSEYEEAIRKADLARARASTGQADTNRKVGESAFDSNEKAIQDAEQKQAQVAAKVGEALKKQGESELDIRDKTNKKAEEQRARASTKEAEQIKLAGERALDAYEESNRKYDQAVSRRTQRQGELAKREQERVAARQNLMNTLPGGKLAAENLFAQAQRVDPAYTPDKIKSVFTEGSTGISQVTYQVETAEGIFKRTAFTVDKFGNVLVSTQKKFRSFGDGLLRDVGEFTKWSIAATLVLAPMKALGDLTNDMIKNEAALADVTITLGDAQRSTAEIFEAGSQIARETGESLGGVIEAYNAAYRATGGAAEPTKRFAEANILLKDAITLSKLSTLNQVEAIDILSASLKQTGMSLTEGTELINKWIAVTKVANVDLTTLATGFSVLGDAADASGMGMEDLSAIIAVLSEATGQSATEVANTARALVSGIQTDASQKQLASLGISLENASGKAKTLVEIVTEVNELRAKGFIDPDSFKELTRVLGGGSRRQASVSTFFDQFMDAEKIKQIYDAAKGAFKETGEAQDTLKTKLDTVESSLTNLGNAFQGLAQSLGTSGGILDIFKTLINFTTSLTDGFTSLSNTLGKTTPVLLTTLTAMAVISRMTTENKAIQMNRLGTAVSDFAGNIAARRLTPGYNTLDPVGSRLDQQMFANGGLAEIERSRQNAGRFAQKALPYAAGVAGFAIPLVENLLSGQNKQALGNGLGGAIGMGLGAAVGGPMGSFIGATLGSAIGEGLANSLQDKKVEFAGFFNEVMTPPSDKEDDGTKPKTQADLENEAVTFLQKITGSKSQFGVGVAKTQGNLDLGLAAILGGQGSKFQGISEFQALQMELEKKSRPDVNGVTAISGADYKKAKELIDIAAAKPIADKARQKEIDDAVNEYKEFIDSARKTEEDQLLKSLQNGTLTVSKYQDSIKKLDGAGSLSSQFYQTFGSASGMGKQQFFNTSTKVIGESSSDEVAKLTKYKEDIYNIDKALAEATVGTADYNIKLSEKAQIMQLASALLGDMNSKLLAQVDLVEDLDFSDLNLEQATIAYKNGEAALNAYTKAQGMSREEAIAFRKEMEKTLVLTNEGWSKPFDLSKEWMQKGLDISKKNGDIPDLKDISFGTQDLTKSEYDNALKGYESLKKQLEGLGYKPVEGEEAKQIEILKDGFTVEKRDQKIIQYLLGQIEKNTKELNGAYNLPEGASFFVPYQAAKMSVDSVGNGNLGGTITDTGDKLISAIDNAAITIANSIFEKNAQIEDLKRRDNPFTTMENSLFEKNAKMGDDSIFNSSISERNAGLSSKREKDFLTNWENTSEERLKLISESYEKTMGRHGYSGDGNPTRQYRDPTTSVFRDADQKSSLDPMRSYSGTKGFREAESLAGGGNITQQLLQGLSTVLNPGIGTGNQMNQTPMFDFNSLLQGLQNISTRLNLTIDNTTTVQLDGRVIASVVKQYLKNDLVRYSNSSSTQTLSVI